MSRYSEKLERRREEAAREAGREAKAERHAAAVAALAAPAPKVLMPAPEFGAASDAPRGLVQDLSSVVDAVGTAVHSADDMVAVCVKGLAKSEALSIRNSLWAVLQKMSALHVRARRLDAIAKEEAAHAEIF